jgi:iron complex transport system substrate-binding protein
MRRTLRRVSLVPLVVSIPANSIALRRGRGLVAPLVGDSTNGRAFGQGRFAVPRAGRSLVSKHVPMPTSSSCHPPSGVRAAFAALSVIVAVLTAACGSSVTSTGSPSAALTTAAATFPVTVQAADGAVTIPHRPKRVVSLSPTATEMLYAIGAGSQVVAVDDQSNYPPATPMTKLSGFEPNVEAIAGYSPDLVVAADGAGGLVHGIQGLGIPILIEPAAADLSDSYAQLEQLGTATGHPGEAGALVARMRQEIASIVAAVPKPVHQLSVYHELDNTYFSATSQTFIGQVYTLLGLKNIADGASSKVADYPQLSAEYIIQSNPDLIVLADTKCCQQDAHTVAARPGWNRITAVQDGQVIPMDDDIASRWGPRIVDFIRTVAQHVTQAEQATSAATASP